MRRSYTPALPHIARRLRYASTPIGFQWSPRRYLVVGGVRFDGIEEGPAWSLASLRRHGCRSVWTADGAGAYCGTCGRVLA